jgi:hypothetical protein
MKKLFTKVKNYFKNKKTKILWIAGFWTVESVLLINSISILLATGSIFTAIGLLAMQAYGTYALFSILVENYKTA